MITWPVLGGVDSTGDRRIAQDWLRVLVPEVSYKPGWRVLLENLAGEVALVAEVTTTCPRTGGRPVVVRVAESWPNLEHITWTRADAVAFIRDFIRHVEMHEADEWFTVAGDRLYDPHTVEGAARRGTAVDGI